MTAPRYATAAALRTALERRLRAQHASTALPLDRLRKEAALQRLLARIVAVAPEGSWALKGGIAMIARVGDRARATADADATWRSSRSELGGVLDRAAGLDLADFFEFTIGQARPIQGEGVEGGIRFPVTARLASKVFENMRIDVNIVAGDPRPVEMIALRNLMDFAGVPPVVVPAIRPDQQLAEKLHAYTRDYGSQENGRAKDLYDMLVIAHELPIPSRTSLAAACRQTFQMRRTEWPPTLKQPPRSWSRAWRGFVADYRIEFANLDSAYEAVVAFWQPVLAEAGPASTWNADTWTWS